MIVELCHNTSNIKKVQINSFLIYLYGMNNDHNKKFGLIKGNIPATSQQQH